MKKINYEELTDKQIKEIRSHWRSEERITLGTFEYAKNKEAAEEEAKRRDI